MSDANELSKNGADNATSKTGWKYYVYRAARLILLCYVGVLVALVLMESRLIYPAAFMGDRGITAESVVDSTRAVGNDSFEVIQYPSSGGELISALFLRRSNTDRVVLYFHGNGEQAAWLSDWAERLSENLDASVLLAEFGGFGNDIGTPSEQTLVADSLSAYDALIKQLGYNDSEIVLYGRSLGGGCATAVAEQRRSKILILERSFDSMVNVAAAKYPVFPVKWLMRNRFESIERLRNYQGAILQIHGTSDRVIPIDHAKQLESTLSSNEREFHTIEGLGHNQRLPQQAFAVIREFIARYQTSE